MSLGTNLTNQVRSTTLLNKFAHPTYHLKLSKLFKVRDYNRHIFLLYMFITLRYFQRTMEDYSSRFNSSRKQSSQRQRQTRAPYFILCRDRDALFIIYVCFMPHLYEPATENTMCILSTRSCSFSHVGTIVYLIYLLSIKRWDNWKQ